MKKKALPEQYLAKIKTAAQLLDKEKAFVDTAVFKINGDYYGFQPFEQKYKKKYTAVAEDRLEKIRERIIEFEEKLKADNINLMVCFISMEEGGAIINIGQEGFKERELIMQELKELEEKHAQIS